MPEENGSTGSTGTTDAGATGGNAGAGAGNTNTGSEKAFTQADLDRAVDQRLNRERAATAEKYGDYDQVKTQLQTLIATGQTEQEKAIEAARTEAAQAARTEERARVLPGLVEAKFQALAIGKVSPAALQGYLEDANLAKFANDKGELDVEAITKRIDSLASKQENFPDLGGGDRGGSSKEISMSDVIRRAAGRIT